MITFSCKDPQITRYCEDRFSHRFQRLLTHYGPDGRIRAQRRMAAVLDREAAAQEWYDYTTDEHGVRTVVRDADGSPVPLVPEVVLG